MPLNLKGEIIYLKHLGEALYVRSSLTSRKKAVTSYLFAFAFYSSDKTLPKSSLQRRVYLIYTSQCITETSQDRNWRQEPGHKNWSRPHRGMLPANLHSMAGSAYFLIQSGPPALGWLGGWALPHQSIMTQSDRSIFSIEHPSSKMPPACIKMTN